jgi:hypothetical protein
MNIARALLLLLDELFGALDATVQGGERAARRGLRRVELSLAATAWRLRIRRLELELDERRVAACYRLADACRRDCEDTDLTEQVRELDQLRSSLAAARAGLEECLR